MDEGAAVTMSYLRNDGNLPEERIEIVDEIDASQRAGAVHSKLTD